MRRPTTMTWAEPRYSKRRVDRAGRALADRSLDRKRRREQIAIVSNFRASHALPLNELQETLREETHGSYDQPVVSQRIKRLPSIIRKLTQMPNMSLTQMQDIGGCRVVVASVDEVESLVSTYYTSIGPHQSRNHSDYINPPKCSGYRAFHIVSRYVNSSNPAFNGMRLEVQFRSELQHAWAMAVETFDLITRQSLKTGSGNPAELRFFALLGAWFAIKEHRPGVPGTPSDEMDLANEIRDIDATYHIITKFDGYRAALKVLGAPETDIEPGLYILHLNLHDRTIDPIRFNFKDYRTALSQYDSLEDDHANDSNHDVVLVSTEALTRAYPSYFGIASRFLDEIKPIVET